MKHEHHHHQPVVPIHGKAKENFFRLAFSATLHCLLGCGFGEIGGMAIGSWLHMTNTSTMILALAMGAFFGLLLGMVPWLRAGYPFKKALYQTIIVEGLSIAVMEIVEVTVQVYTPGVMESHPSDWLFWKGMLFGLGAGFVAAFPVNYIFVKRGIRHRH
jgi:hypothetical protein